MKRAFSFRESPDRRLLSRINENDIVVLTGSAARRRAPAMKDPGKSKPRPRGRPRSEQSKEAILEAAYDLLKKRGIRSVSAQELARRAGVSTATLYRWWKNKEAIMLEAFLARVKPALAP